MNTPNPPSSVPPQDGLSIAAVERDTGLPKDTLRVWERRYGFPHPNRDELGERVYPPEQVERLRLIARLLNAGLRPGRVVSAPLAQLQEMLQTTSPGAPSGADPMASEIELCLGLLRQHQVRNLRHMLNQLALRLGLEQFVVKLVSPLTRWVGEAWVLGEIQVFEEHMYTETITAVLRQAIGNMVTAPQPDRPHVLLTTFPQEAHGLGLLMAETLLALEGCHCISLGVQTPISDIARAAAANQAQIVGLSFSPNLPAAQVVQGLTELRALLPSSVAIWAGGSHPALRRKPIDGVTVVAELAGIHALLAAWQTPDGVCAARTAP